MHPFNYGPVGILVHSDKVLSTLIAEKICTDTLERVFWCQDRVRCALGCEGAFLWQSVQRFLCARAAVIMPGQKTFDIVCERMGSTLW